MHQLFTFSHMDPYLNKIIIFNIPLSNSTFDKNSSYYSRFFAAASFTIWLNVSRSRENRIESVLAIIVAALGTLYNNANSPKDSPGWYTF